MFQRLNQRLIIVLALICAALIWGEGSTALAGGWAVVTLDGLPAQVVAEQPIRIGFMVRQHGRTPLAGLAPQIRAIHTETQESFVVTAKPEGEEGRYVATLIFPQPGGWNWSIQAFTMDQPMPTLKVLAAEPATAAPTTLPASWLLLVGVAGLIGAAGTSLLWRRKRAWWTAALVVALALMSGAGFVSAASYGGQTEPEAVSAAPVERGRDLFIAKGCIVCHHHSALSEVRRDLADFRIGPDLPSVMTMSANPEFLHTWLKDPATVKPETQMPNLELKESEIEALTAFLLEPATHTAR